MANPTILRARKGWAFPNFRETWHFRDLFFLLVLRDIKLKYKQTAIGVLWVILQPLATALLFSLIFGYIAKFTTPGIPYLLFAFSGMLAWLLFSQILQRTASSFLGDTRLISKVYFPRLVLPLASATAVWLDFIVALSLMLLLIPLYGVPYSWNLLFLFPIALSVFLLSTSLGCFFAAWNVHYRDFVHVIPFLLQLWMYASPLFYPTTLLPESIKRWFLLNPLVGYIDAFRWSLLGIGDFPWATFGSSLLFTFVVAILCMLFFDRLERTFADVI
jgi:lipopolysaccharide transport system permease protein